MTSINVEDVETKRQRYLGALAGLVVADAMETCLNSAWRGSFRAEQLVNNSKSLRPDRYGSEASSMALCLCESLDELWRFDPIDQLERYRRFYREGHLASTPRGEVSAATRQAVEYFERTHEPFPGDRFPHAEGAGPLTRVAPVAMAFRQDPRLAIEHAAESARATHGSREVIDATRYLAALLVGALNGVDTSELTGEELFEPVAGIWDAEPLSPGIAKIPSNLHRDWNQQPLRQGDVATETLEAALRALSSTNTFDLAVFTGIEYGFNNRSSAVVCGQLAGAVYGFDAIPQGWFNHLMQDDMIKRYAVNLMEFDAS